MTTSVQSLASWLLERITEDEAAARKAVPSPWRIDDDGCCVFAPEGRGDDVAEMTWDSAEHIARWQPARVLAECEAKRALLRWYGDGSDVGDGGQFLCLLAVPYADREGFREEWAV
ncbi:MAG TPA: DUF6221 family protein [Solirubrobacteraceae bacterium]|nr:DUF6221 family protein [Solirubrobacteraceae bacterium]